MGAQACAAKAARLLLETINNCQEFGRFRFLFGSPPRAGTRCTAGSAWLEDVLGHMLLMQAQAAELAPWRTSCRWAAPAAPGFCRQHL